MFWDLVGSALGGGLLGGVGDVMTGDQSMGGLLSTTLEDIMKSPNEFQMKQRRAQQGRLFNPMDPMQAYNLQNPMNPYPVMNMFDFNNGGGQW